MTFKTMLTATAVAAVLTLPGAAFAQSSATATTDLNLRAGPGPQHGILATIPADGQVSVAGCIEGSAWCQVSFNGTEGWAYSEYLTTDLSGERVVVTQQREAIGVPTTTYDGGSTVTGAVGGAVVGALVGGPVGAAVGGAVGAAGANIVDPPQRVNTYVTSNQPDPVFLEGEVVVGAGVPETVTLHEVPDFEYRYAYVNQQPVLVDPNNRQIVYVYR